MLIESERLRVSLREPERVKNYRFDHSTFIDSIVLDGKYEFCMPEPDNMYHPTTHGVGLCCEYQCEDAYNEVKAGEYFPKFGVGLQKKEDMREYCFYREYETIPFETDCHATKREIMSLSEPIPCGGFAMRQMRVVSVDGNTLEMRTTIKNVGEKPLRIREYCHNFLSLEQRLLGPEYEVHMPEIMNQDAKGLTGTIIGKGSGFSFSAHNPGASYVILGSRDIKQCTRFDWSIKHRESPVTINGTEHFMPVEIVFWTNNNIICCENFIEVDLTMGGECEWKRSWVFDLG